MLLYYVWWEVFCWLSVRSLVLCQKGSQSWTPWTKEAICYLTDREAFVKTTFSSVRQMFPMSCWLSIHPHLSHERNESVWHGRRTHSRGYWRSGRCSCFTLKSESDACQIDLITQMAHNRWDVLPENSFMLKTWHQNVKLIHHPRSDCIHLSLWSLIAMETPRVQKSVPNVFLKIIFNLLLAVVEGITKVFFFFQSSLLLWSTDCSFTFSLSEKIHHQSFFFFWLKNLATKIKWCWRNRVFLWLCSTDR